MVDRPPKLDSDPIIELYKQFIDLDEIKVNLRLTHEERLQKLVRRLHEVQSENSNQ
jgi:hypothetical protein